MEACLLILRVPKVCVGGLHLQPPCQEESGRARMQRAPWGHACTESRALFCHHTPWKSESSGEGGEGEERKWRKSSWSWSTLGPRQEDVLKREGGWETGCRGCTLVGQQPQDQRAIVGVAMARYWWCSCSQLYRNQRFEILGGTPFLFLSAWSGSNGKESSCSSRNLGLIPESARSPGEGNGNPLQYSCLENPHRQEPGGLQSMGLLRVGHDWDSVLSRELHPSGPHLPRNNSISPLGKE